jgi:hypothetical protein
MLWSVCASGTVRHYQHVAALLIHQIEHVRAHPIYLFPIDFEKLVRSFFLSGAASQSKNDVFPLLLVLDGIQADHRVVMQQGHHAVRVVDQVTISVIGGECYRLVRLECNLVPLS